METLVAAQLLAFRDDAAEMLEWGYGPMAKQIFIENILEDDQRPGQAFMNVLRMYDIDSYVRLRDSLEDPFYDDSKIPAALDLMTRK
jgi:hypothetical protein